MSTIKELPSQDSLPSSKPDQIRCHFLRLLLRYSGHLSIQLHPIHNWSNLLSLVWNLLLNTAYYLTYLTHGPSQTNSQAINNRLRRVFIQKPLFALVFDIGLQFAFTFAYFLTTCYFLHLSLFNRQLIHQLNAISSGIFASKTKAYQVFAYLVLGHHAIFIFAVITTMNSPLNSVDYSYLSLPQIVIGYYIFYSLNINGDIALFLAQYAKHATLIELKRLTEVCSGQNSREIESTFRQLALTNKRLNEMLSFPILISIATYTFNVILALASLSIPEASGLANAFLLQFLLTSSHLAYLSRRIDKQCSVIEKKLGSRGRQVLFRSQRRVIHKPSMVEIYREAFKLKLFELITFEWRFLFHQVLFMFNYIVLVTQTTF